MQMDIVYSSTELLNIKRLTVVNGNACYEIEVKDKDKAAKACKHKFVCTGQINIRNVNAHSANAIYFQPATQPQWMPAKRTPR